MKQFSAYTLNDGIKSKYGQETFDNVEETVEYVTYFNNNLLIETDPEKIEKLIDELKLGCIQNFSPYGAIIQIIIKRI